MNHIQMFKTPSGEEMVILSRQEYDDLVAAAADAAEDAADAAIYAARKAELVAGNDAVLPAELSAAVHRGDSRLKAIRKWRRLGQVDVSAHLGVSQGYLSDLETGRRNATADIVHKLADLYNVPESWLA